MIAAVLKETLDGERRVAIIPAALPVLARLGLEVVVEAGAGNAAGFPDAAFVEKGARIVGSRAEALRAENVVRNGVTVMGPVNLAASVPFHASQMYARNLSAFLGLLVKDGALALDTADDIIRETLVARGGEVVHPRVREALGLSAPVAPPVAAGA